MDPGCMPEPEGLPEVFHPPDCQRTRKTSREHVFPPERLKAKVDNLHQKTQEVMMEFAILAIEDQEQYPEEQDCLLTYSSKMLELQLITNRQFERIRAEDMAEDPESTKQRKRAKFDQVEKKSDEVMKEWASLGGANPEQFAEEQDVLATYIGNIIELQLKRKGQISEASDMAEINAAYSRIKHHQQV